MSGLVEKLEAAEVGSRSLDQAVWLATGGWEGVNAPPSFTTSLDAALALAERVLPGWFVGLQQNRWVHREGPAWAAYLTPPKSSLEIEGDGPTPALALCIAICRALNLNETRHAE